MMGEESGREMAQLLVIDWDLQLVHQMVSGKGVVRALLRDAQMALSREVQKDEEKEKGLVCCLVVAM